MSMQVHCKTHTCTSTLLFIQLCINHFDNHLNFAYNICMKDIKYLYKRAEDMYNLFTIIHMMLWIAINVIIIQHSFFMFPLHQGISCM